MPIEKFRTPDAESRRRTEEELRDYDDLKAEELGAESEYQHEKIPRDLIPTAEFTEREGIFLEEVYKWYAAAISRRDREPLEGERFVAHFESLSIDPTFAFGNKDRGYLLGYLKFGVFVPTHFAPKTMRGGYDLIKRLGESASVPAVMSITDDLSDTLAKIPSWKVLDLGFLATFRDEPVEKVVVYNSHPDTKQLMLGLIAEYLDEAKGAGF